MSVAARRIVVALALVLAALTIGAIHAAPTPEAHHTVVPVATAVIAAAWLFELTPFRLPRPALAVLVTAPNIWMIAVGHASVNLVFLLLLVPWIAMTGSRPASVVALLLSLLTVGVGAAEDAVGWSVATSGWLAWALGAIVLWLLSEMLLHQRGLVRELQIARERSRAEQRENERLRQTAERYARELEALHAADEHLRRPLQTEHALQALADIAVEYLQADRCAVHVWDPEQQRLVTRATRDSGQAPAVHSVYAPGEGVVGTVFESGRMIAVEDVLTAPRATPTPTTDEGIRPIISVPIVIDGQVHGVFSASYREPRTFPESEKRLFASLAQRAAVAIQHARRYEQPQHGAALEYRQQHARELHDAVTQSLFSVMLLAEACRRLSSAGESDRAGEYLERLSETAQQALKKHRLLIEDL